jgi:hypothetical protein
MSLNHRGIDFQAARFPGYVPGSEFCIKHTNLLATPVTNLFAAATTGFQWAVTGYKLGVFNNGAAAWAATITLNGKNGAPVDSDVRWFSAVDMTASVQAFNDQITFPPDDPLLFGSGNPVAVFIDTALAASIFVIAIVKGYQIAI